MTRKRKNALQWSNVLKGKERDGKRGGVGSDKYAAKRARTKEARGVGVWGGE